jgi:hypothetical protein
MELTIHNIDPTIVTALKNNAEKTGMKLNDYVITLIEGKVKKNTGSSTLEKLAGQWTDQEYSEFISNTNQFNQIDAELWK